MADHRMKAIFEEYKFRSIKVLFCAILSIVIFSLAGGWGSARDSIANARWLKSVTPNGVDQQLLYPLGVCGDGVALSKEGERNAPQPASPYLAGLAALRIGDLLTAEQLLQRAMDEGISLNSSPYALGVVYYLQGKDAIPIWGKNNDIIRMLIIGKMCDLEENKEVASDYYRFVIENINLINNYSKIEIFQQLVEFFATTDDEEAFDLSLQSYLNLADPDSLYYYWTLATAWRDHGQPSRALEYYQVILKRTPEDPNTWWNTGRAYQALEDYDNARDYYIHAYELNPENINYYIYIGNTYLFQQQYDQAGEWFEKAIAIDPNNIWALTNLTLVRKSQNRNEEALMLIIHVMELAPDAYLRALASDVAINIQNWQLAKQYVNEAIKLESDNLDYYRKLGLICGTLMDNACRKQAYQNILRLDPLDKDIKQKLEELVFDGE